MMGLPNIYNFWVPYLTIQYILYILYIDMLTI